MKLSINLGIVTLTDISISYIIGLFTRSKRKKASSKLLEEYKARLAKNSSGVKRRSIYNFDKI